MHEQATVYGRPTVLRTIAAIVLAFVVQGITSGLAALVAERLYRVWLNASAGIAGPIGMAVGAVVGVALARSACDRWLRPYSRAAVAWTFAIVMCLLFVVTALSGKAIGESIGALTATAATGLGAWWIFRQDRL